MVLNGGAGDEGNQPPPAPQRIDRPPTAAFASGGGGYRYHRRQSSSTSGNSNGSNSSHDHRRTSSGQGDEGGGEREHQQPPPQQQQPRGRHHRRIASTPGVVTASRKHQQPNGGKHRRRSSYAGGHASTTGGTCITARPSSCKNAATPSRGRAQLHRHRHSIANDHHHHHHYAAFGSNGRRGTSLVQGIADQFHQYQCETVQQRQRTTRPAQDEHTTARTDGIARRHDRPSRCCDDCCTYCFIPCCCVCGWLCCSNLSSSNVRGDADEEAGGAGGGVAPPPPPHYQKIDPFHRVLALDGGITPTARAAGIHPWCGVVPALCYSVLLLIVLLSMSSTTKFIDESHRTWTLRPGETRQVPVPALFNKDIRISTTTRQRSSDEDGFADSDGRGIVNVYSFDGDCPPLTGPPVVLEKGSRTLELAKGDYQYDYFFLNQGSSLHVHVQQLQGSSNIHLMIGDQVLERLVHENRDYAYDGGFKDSLVRQFVTAAAPTTTTKGAEEDPPHQVSLDYTARETETYIVIYENAATRKGGRGVLSVNYRVSLSSYDLQPYSPVCRVVHSNTEADDNDDDDDISTTTASAAAVNACVLTKASAVHGQGCLLVQASSTTTTDYQSSNNSTSSAVSTIIHVNETRRWVPLLLCSTVPFLLVIMIRACSNEYRRKMEDWYDKVDTDDEYMEHPLPSQAVLTTTTRKEEDHPLFATVPMESDGLLQFSAAAASSAAARGGDVDGSSNSSSVYYDAIPIAVLPANNEAVAVPAPPRYPGQGSSSNGITAKAEGYT